MIIIGIDPGLTGGVAVLHNDKALTPLLFRMPVMGTSPKLIDVTKLVGLVDQADRVIIERQQAMPKQGVKSSFTIGENYGRICGALEASKLPIMEVRPSQWKRRAGLLKKTKKDSVALAKRLYPSTASAITKASDEGMAEALLIAHFGEA